MASVSFFDDAYNLGGLCSVVFVSKHMGISFPETSSAALINSFVDTPVPVPTFHISTGCLKPYFKTDR